MFCYCLYEFDPILGVGENSLSVVSTNINVYISCTNTSPWNELKGCLITSPMDHRIGPEFQSNASRGGFEHVFLPWQSTEFPYLCRALIDIHLHVLVFILDKKFQKTYLMFPQRKSQILYLDVLLKRLSENQRNNSRKTPSL